MNWVVKVIWSLAQDSETHDKKKNNNKTVNFHGFRS